MNLSEMSNKISAIREVIMALDQLDTPQANERKERLIDEHNELLDQYINMKSKGIV